MPGVIVQAPNGRVLNVYEGGDPGGSPVVYHHGTPMCGRLYEPHIRDAGERGLRLIGYDRPGYGGSTPDPDRAIAGAAADVEAICDALGLERIATWGISGGGPHALACAALLPDRVVGAASLAGVAPYDADGLDWLAGMGEANIEEFGAVLAGRDVLTPLLEREAAEMLATPVDQVTEALLTLLSQVDRQFVGGELGVYLHESSQGALAGGVDGWVDDDLAFALPWGFDPAAIEVPVLVWQGREDRFVPFSHGEWLASRIPGAEARLTAEDGHLTLIGWRVPDVHAWLAERFLG